MYLYQNKDASPEDRADDLLGRMSFEEKVAQLSGYNPASWSTDNLEKEYPMGAGQVSFLAGVDKHDIFEAAEFQRQLQKKLMELSPHRIPAIFHVETLCGVMLPGATSFPSGIGQGATFDPCLQKEVGNLIGKQARAAGTAQAFAPVLDISRDARFGRQGETYGEDPALAAAMGSAYVQGLQQAKEKNIEVIATAKHFLGYHDSQGGIHAAACDIPERLLREIYAKPFQAAITESNLSGIMPCYSSINGVPVACSEEILTKLLVEEMGFEGLVVSDYSSVQEIYERHHVCESYEDAGIRALMAGMNQELPSKKCYTEKTFRKAAEDRKFRQRLDETVKKILTIKFKVGLFENPYAAADEEIRKIYSDFCNSELAHRAALESLVLVKNNGVLPLEKKEQTIAVIGYHGASLRAMFGGYTYMSMTESMLGAQNTMAGVNKKIDAATECETYPGTVVEKEHPDAEKLAKSLLHGSNNLLEELRQRVPQSRFLYAYGYPYTGYDCNGHAVAMKVAEKADVLIMTVGGKYGTGTTASMGEGIDGTDINLPFCQEELIRQMAKLGKPLILVHFGGRPISSDAADQYADAVLEAWNPGEEGASAIVSALFGEYNPGGRMPVSTPYNAGQIPVYYNHPYGSSYHQNTISAFRQYVDCPHEPRYYFGYGLSYTTFEYQGMNIDNHSLRPDEKLEGKIIIRNSGERDGDEVVQIYVRDCQCSMVRPVMELAAFGRFFIKAGETQTLRFTIQMNQFAFLDQNMRWKIENGDMEVMIGTSAGNIKLRDIITISEDAYIDGRKRGFYGKVEKE